MKKIITVLALLSLTACATTAYDSAPQNYRMKGEEKTVSIKGKLAKKTGVVIDDHAVAFTMNDDFTLGFQLDGNGNGSLSCDSEKKDKDDLFYCKPYKGKRIGANCMGSTRNTALIRVNCSFEIDGENAANFTF